MTTNERKARKHYPNKETVVGILERDGEIRVAHFRKQDAQAKLGENVEVGIYGCDRCRNRLQKTRRCFVLLIRKYKNN